MANLNAQVKRKQLVLLMAAVLGLGAAGGTGWYISNLHMQKQARSTQAAKEPAPDMTGVVNASFDDKVQKNAITETQTSNKELQKEMALLQKSLNDLSRDRTLDQQRLETLEKENAQLKDQQASSSAAPSGEPAPFQPITPAGNTGTASGAVPPPTQFYPGTAGLPQGSNVTFTPVAPVQQPGALDTTDFHYQSLNTKPKLPYIPSGSFAGALVIEGADTNAAVTGAQNTAPMQFRLTGKVQMPNDHEFDLTGCFVNAEAYGDVSSERAEVRTRSISCQIGDDVIDQKIAGHVSFMGKNGIKGNVVMRNGEILGWAWGAGALTGLGEGISKAATPQVGIGATSSMGAGDVAQAGIGGGTSQAAKTLSDYYIKRAEQYHPVIPIGAGNDVTVVFQDGFQLETIEEARLKKSHRTQLQQQTQQQSGDPLSTPSMMNQLKDLKVGDLVHPDTN